MGTTIALIVCAALAAAAIVSRLPRRRAWATVGALVLAPVLLAYTIRDTSPVQSLIDRPLVLAALAGGALAVLVLLAQLFRQRPQWFVIAVALTLPFRVPIAVGGTVSNLLLPLYMVIGAGALAYVWAVFGADSGQDAVVPGRRARLLEWLVAAALLLYAIGASWSIDRGQAIENLVFFYVPFALMFAQLTRQRYTTAMLTRAAVALVLLALAFAAVGFVEYATRHLLLNPKIIASNQIESYFRVNSLFFDPNVYGRFLAVVMLIITSVMLWARRGAAIWQMIVLLAVLWAGLLLTLSQSSFMALLVGLAVLAGLRWSAKWTAIGVGSLLVCATVIVLVASGPLKIGFGSGSEVNRATSGRYDLVVGGLSLAADAPLIGHGSGSFSRAYRRAEHGSARNAVSASHTIPITVAAEQGILGLLLYSALVVSAISTLLRASGVEPVRTALAAAFCAIVAHSWAYAAFLEDPVTWVLLGVGVALAAAVESGSWQGRSRRTTAATVLPAA